MYQTYYAAIFGSTAPSMIFTALPGWTLDTTINPNRWKETSTGRYADVITGPDSGGVIRMAFAPSALVANFLELEALFGHELQHYSDYLNYWDTYKGTEAGKTEFMQNTEYAGNKYQAAIWNAFGWTAAAEKKAKEVAKMPHTADWLGNKRIPEQTTTNDPNDGNWGCL